MYNLDLATLKKYFLLNNSFEEDFFQRFAASVSQSALSYFFNLVPIEQESPSLAEFTNTLQTLTHRQGLTQLTEQFVTEEAFLAALPHLDTLITKGGIVTTSGEGITPASQARVERLLEQIRHQHQRTTEQLYFELKRREYSSASPHIRIATYAHSVLQDPRLLQYFYNDDYLHHFFTFYNAIQNTDTILAQNYLGTRLVEKLKNDAYKIYADPDNATEAEQTEVQFFASICAWLYYEHTPYKPALKDRQEEQKYTLTHEHILTDIRTYIRNAPAEIAALYDTETDPLGINPKPRIQNTNNLVI